MHDDGRRGRGKATHDAVFDFPLLGLDDVLPRRQGLFLGFLVGQGGAVGLDDALQSSYEATAGPDAFGDSSLGVGEVFE